MLFLITGFFMAPYAEHSFLLKAIRKLYYAKTEDASIFLQPKSDKFIKKMGKKRRASKKLTREQRKDINSARTPKVSLKSNCLLFW